MGFYSGSKLGPRDNRIVDTELTRLKGRIDKQKGVTAYNVNIPGEQREPFASKCNKCGTENDVSWKSEKGIDSSLIVHLFDTMEAWDRSYLLSGDADFVPAVKSLRRRGKIINGAGFLSSASSALVKECFEFLDLMTFFKQDFGAYELLKKDGLIETVFTHFLKTTRVMDRARLIINLEAVFTSNKTILTLVSNIIDYEKRREEKTRVLEATIGTGNFPRST